MTNLLYKKLMDGYQGEFMKQVWLACMKTYEEEKSSEIIKIFFFLKTFFLFNDKKTTTLNSLH